MAAAAAEDAPDERGDRDHVLDLKGLRAVPLPEREVLGRDHRQRMLLGERDVRVDPSDEVRRVAADLRAIGQMRGHVLHLG